VRIAGLSKMITGGTGVGFRVVRTAGPGVLTLGGCRELFGKIQHGVAAEKFSY
jgi:hypothetical protein